MKHLTFAAAGLLVVLAGASAQAQQPIRCYDQLINPHQTVSRFKEARGLGYEMRKLVYASTGLVAHGKRMLPETLPAGEEVWVNPTVLSTRPGCDDSHDEVLLDLVWEGVCGNKVVMQSWFPRPKAVVITKTVTVRERVEVPVPVQVPVAPPVFETVPVQHQWQRQCQSQSQSVNITINQAPAPYCQPVVRQIGGTSRSESSVLGSLSLLPGFRNTVTTSVPPPGSTTTLTPGLPGSPAGPLGGTGENNVPRPPTDPASGNMFPGAPAPLPAGSAIPGGPIQRR